MQVNILKLYVCILVLSALLGTSLLYIDIGIRLSVYRIFLLLAPVFLVSIDKRRYSLLNNNFNKSYLQMLIIWVVYAFITLFWVNDYAAWFKNILFLVSAALTTTLVGVSFETEKDFVKAFRCVEIMLLFHCALCLYDVFTGSYMFIESSMKENYSTSNTVTNNGLWWPSGLLGNTNTVSLHMYIGLINSMALLFYKKSRGGRFFSAVAVVLFFITMILGESRGAIVAFFVAISVIGLVYYNRLNRKKKLDIKIVLLGVLGFVLYMGISSYINDFLIKGSEDSDFARINLLKNGIMCLKDHYFMGVGLGNIEYHMERFQYYNTYGFTNIHNWWFEILVSSGIFVFLIYIYIYIYNLHRALLRNKKLIFSAVCFFGLFCGYIIVSMTSSSMMGMEGVWMYIGLLFMYMGKSFIFNADTRIDRNKNC